MKKLLLSSAFCAAAMIAGAQNPFAYDISVGNVTDGVVDGSTVTVKYTLNADAVSGSIQFDKINYVHPLTGDLLKKGSHEVELSTSLFNAGEVNLLSITTTGEALNEAKEVFSDLSNGGTHQYWSPYGIAIDNNMQSKHFGRVLVTETQANMGSSYFTQSLGKGAGLYEYDPQGNPVMNGESYGYNPLNFTSFKYTGGAASEAFHAKKVRISEDGRIFVGVLNTVNNPLYTLNPDNLNEWTPVFEGTLETETASGYINDEQGNMIAAPSAAFDVIGSGEDTKIVNLGCKFGQNFAYGSYTMYEYPIGEANTWSQAATDEVMPLSLQYTISSQAVTIAYDQDGNGIWYCQYRGIPSELQPSLKHVSESERRMGRRL